LPNTRPANMVLTLAGPPPATMALARTCRAEIGVHVNHHPLLRPAAATTPRSCLPISPMRVLGPIAPHPAPHPSRPNRHRAHRTIAPHLPAGSFLGGLRTPAHERLATFATGRHPQTFTTADPETAPVSGRSRRRLNGAGDAHQLLESRRSQGKILLTLDVV
jgi:hypothetical protein